MCLMLNFINWSKFIVWLPLFLKILGNTFCYICLLTRLWRHKIWNKPDLPNQAVLLQNQNVNTKIEVSWQRKELLRWSKKYFSLFLTGFQLSKIISDLRVHLLLNRMPQICFGRTLLSGLDNLIDHIKLLLTYIFR